MGKDLTMPTGKWQFDDSVTAVFDDMLERSIPMYNVMREACLMWAKAYRQKGTDIVDLGCSRGGAMSALVDEYGATNRFVGVEVSEPMLNASRKRFEGFPDSVVTIKDLDLRESFPSVRASVILSVLTIQFVPIEYRLNILQNVYDHLIKNGAFIFVEKVIGSTAIHDKRMVDFYLDFKRSNGYTEEQIQRKKLSLEGALVPLPAKMNEQMLAAVGFNKVDCFWRWMNFAAWVAIK